MTIRIVFVDDEPVMREIYLRNLRTELVNEQIDVEIFDFTDPSAAIAYIVKERGSIDLVVTDIFFPPEGQPDAPFEDHAPLGLEVVRKAKEFTSAAVCAFSIGNLSRYADLPNVAKSAGAHYFTYRQLIQDPMKIGWSGFGRVIRDLLESRAKLLEEQGGSSVESPHHLVFVALGSELEVLKRRWHLLNHYGQPYWETRLDACKLPIRVLPAYGPGRVRAATTTLKYLLSPAGAQVRSVTVLGICGGFTEAHISQGNIIVPETLVDLGTRKVQCLESPEFRLVPDDVGAACLEAIRSGDFELKAWVDECTELPYYPKGTRPVLIDGGSMICADEVVASDEWRAKLMAAWPKAAGVEMESGGVAAACRAAASTAPLTVMRGVSDKADPLKTDDQWRTLAMESVALLYARYVALL